MHYQVGGCTQEEWIESIRADAQAIVGPERVEALMNAWQEAERLLNPLMISLVERLRAGGYRTGIISNTIPGMEDRIKREFPHLIPLFDVLIGSGDIGLAKPAPAIFEHALREMGVPVETSVFADDVRSYADAACAVGMHGFHVTGYDQFASDLRSIGVEV